METTIMGYIGFGCKVRRMTSLGVLQRDCRKLIS